MMLFHYRFQSTGRGDAFSTPYYCSTSSICETPSWSSSSLQPRACCCPSACVASIGRGITPMNFSSASIRLLLLRRASCQLPRR